MIFVSLYRSVKVKEMERNQGPTWCMMVFKDDCTKKSSECSRYVKNPSSPKPRQVSNEVCQRFGLGNTW